jgi:hypothetical protein
MSRPRLSRESHAKEKLSDAALGSDGLALYSTGSLPVNWDDWLVYQTVNVEGFLHLTNSFVGGPALLGAACIKVCSPTTS